MTRLSRSKMVCKFVVAMACMLSTSGALAMSYSIRSGYESDMCRAVRNAFAEGLVLDATHPLCERRFELSPEAKRLGLSNVDKKLLPRSSYPALLRQIVAIDRGKKNSKSSADQIADEQAVSRLMKDNSLKIYSSHFDADNSGKVRQIYMEEFTSCDVKDSYPYDSVTTYIQKNDGSLDPSWGANEATAGIPYIYKNHTYYMTWESLKGTSDGNFLEQVNVSDAMPYIGYIMQINHYNVFAPPVCIIYQTKKRVRP